MEGDNDVNITCTHNTDGEKSYQWIGIIQNRIVTILPYQNQNHYQKWWDANFAETRFYIDKDGQVFFSLCTSKHKALALIREDPHFGNCWCPTKFARFPRIEKQPKRPDLGRELNGWRDREGD